MKKFFLKTLDVILTIVMVLSVLYAIFNLVMTFLPADIQRQVYDFLNMSQEYIATFSISSVVNAVVLVGSKLIQTYNKIQITKQLAKAEEIIANDVAVNEAVIAKQNEIINNLRVLQELDNALLSVQKVTTERNIKASDLLVYKSEKEAYSKALEEIEQAKQQLAEVDNLTTVYEKTEVKEVIVEKEQEKPSDMSGRV
ncbi:MAG: hypothetical protein IJX25_00265 [Clostridia bacterium]|nr:hypothetical protein [Clostridia bacterium]